jgi:hypothetical protein
VKCDDIGVLHTVKDLTATNELATYVDSELVPSMGRTKLRETLRPAFSFAWGCSAYTMFRMSTGASTIAVELTRAATLCWTSWLLSSAFRLVVCVPRFTEGGLFVSWRTFCVYEVLRGGTVLIPVNHTVRTISGGLGARSGVE